MSETGLFIIYLIILSISFLCSLSLFFRKTKYTHLKLFAPFLLLTLIIETIAFSFGGSPEYNKVYNIFYLIEIIFYGYIFKKSIQNRFGKKALVVLLVTYTMFAFVNSLFLQGIIYPYYNYSLGSFLIVLFCIYCFNELFKAPTSLEILRNPTFWISTGLIVFYACTFPMWAGTDLMMNVPKRKLIYFRIMIDLVNCILYSSFSMAFLCEVIFKRSEAK